MQRRRNRRRVQESHLPETHSSEEVTVAHAVLPSAGSPTNQLENEQCNLIAARSSVTILTPEQTRPCPRRKRSVREMGAEEKADRAANEIVDLVEQEVQHSTSRTTGS